MQNANECLKEAMFVASESYSGSAYEIGPFEAMNKACDEYADLIQDGDVTNLGIMAAA